MVYVSPQRRDWPVWNSIFRRYENVEGDYVDDQRESMLDLPLADAKRVAVAAFTIPDGVFSVDSQKV